MSKKSLYTPMDYTLMRITPDSKLTVTFYDEIVHAIHSVKKPLKDRVAFDLKIGNKEINKERGC